MNEASEEEVMFALCMVALRKFVSPTRKICEPDEEKENIS
jgi:hypothetical protein